MIDIAIMGNDGDLPIRIYTDSYRLTSGSETRTMDGFETELATQVFGGNDSLKVDDLLVQNGSRIAWKIAGLDDEKDVEEASLCRLEFSTHAKLQSREDLQRRLDFGMKQKLVMGPSIRPEGPR